LGQAIAYTLGLWQELTAFLHDGHIDIDNSPAENAIRPFVVASPGCAAAAPRAPTPAPPGTAWWKLPGPMA
jgi:hypothetical protein